MHEMKRLARNTAELMTLSATLQSGGIRLELLTGPLTGIYDPHGMGSILLAVLAVAASPTRGTAARRPSSSPTGPKRTSSPVSATSSAPR